MSILGAVPFSGVGPVITMVISLVLIMLEIPVVSKMSLVLNDNLELNIMTFTNASAVFLLMIIYISSFFAYLYGGVELDDADLTSRAIFLSILTYRYFAMLARMLYFRISSKYSVSSPSHEAYHRAGQFTLYIMTAIIMVAAYVPMTLFGIEGFKFAGSTYIFVDIGAVVLPAWLINLAIDQFWNLHTNRAK